MGPNERPPVHSQDEEFGDDDGADSDEDEEALAQRIESIKRAQGVVQILAPNKINKSYQMTVSVAKAEYLPKVDADEEAILRPFVSARVVGLVHTTNVKRNVNPNFNAKL